ncbi:translocase of chloroplast 120, chloroplastic [Iris pallida]|uniref:Translocase of chloroplast 120, chloroplastic n=1 Tax=Iris pallida TaxID=29817 RepID=A0AAX6H720_IRIPA|nr:translocase of chloroplast 120, chloroplastic [Iris pallida]
MENGVEIAPVAAAKGPEEAAAGEQECFYTPAYRHLDLGAEDQEGFYTPVFRHGGSVLMEGGFSTPRENGGGGHGDVEFPLDPSGSNGVVDHVDGRVEAVGEEPVVLEKTDEAVDARGDAVEEKRGDINAELNDAEGDSVVTDDGEGAYEDGEQGFVADRKSENGKDHHGLVSDASNIAESKEESGNGDGETVGAVSEVAESAQVVDPEQDDVEVLDVSVSDGQIGNGEIVGAISDVAESTQEVDPEQDDGEVLDVSVSNRKSDGQIGNGEIVEAASDVVAKSTQEVDPEQDDVQVLDLSVSDRKSDGQIGKQEIVGAVSDVAESTQEVEQDDDEVLDVSVSNRKSDGQIRNGEIVEAVSDVVAESTQEVDPEQDDVEVLDLSVSDGKSDGQIGNGEIVEAVSDVAESTQEVDTEQDDVVVLDVSVSSRKSDGQIGNGDGEIVEAVSDVTESTQEVDPEQGNVEVRDVSVSNMKSDGQIGTGEIVGAVSDVREPTQEVDTEQDDVEVLDVSVSNRKSDGQIGTGETVEAVSDVAEPKQEVDPGQVLDGSASVGKADGMQSEAVGTAAKTYASVVKEGLSGKPEKQAEGDGPSSRSRPEIREEHEDESVSVEDLGESSSRDYGDNGSSSRPAASTTSRLQNSGTSSLPARPAGLGSSAPLLEPTPRAVPHPKVNGAVPQRAFQPLDDPTSDDPEENDETRKKLQDIRVKFLRLARRLGQTPHNVVVAQVLYRLGLAEQLRRNTNRPGVFSFDRASVMAEQLEAAGEDLTDFTCTIMVIGKAGVGKSATINSILDEDSKKVHTDPFEWGTKKVQVINGKVQGVQVRVIDTPGLFTCSSDQQRNRKILTSVKKLISKTPPDIVLYFDRLDMQSRDNVDLLLLRTITDVFGPSIWFNAIVVLTHSASAPPDGPNGVPLSYEMFVTQRSHVVQQAIRAAAGDVRLMNPVSLVENHTACRTNGNGQRVLPNGQVWKPQLLLLSFASKILAEANMLLKLQDTPTGRPFGAGSRIPPLPFFLSPLLQSRPQLRLPEDELSDDDTGVDDLDGVEDSDGGSDYDDLPPFKNLTRAQLAKLSKAQKKAYFEELEYREKLFLKKQLKEERRRRKFMKDMAEKAAKDLPNDYNGGDTVEEDESSGPASVPVPLPDLVLPASFDSDNPTHRYRFLDTSNQWVVRPVLETQGWDHDIGYEGLNLERLFVVRDKVPVSVSGQLTKDKKECTLQMEVASSIKHGEAGSTSLSLDVQTLGKDVAYTARGETRVKNFGRNSTTAGVSVSVLGDAVSAGAKVEDRLVVNRRLRLLVSGGAMAGRGGDVAYGGRLEATLRDKDHPVGRALSTLALSVVDWRGDLAVGCNVQSQLPVGRGTHLVGHANLSNRGTGQVGIRLNSSEQLQIALLALLPIAKSLKRLLFEAPESMM